MPSSFQGVSRAPLNHLPGSSGASTSLATTYRRDVNVVQVREIGMLTHHSFFSCD